MDNRYDLRQPDSGTGRQVNCRRCGTCCRKGGPCLHSADMHLVEKGRISIKDLFTIRQGEPARDNVRNRVRPAAEDIIKIKSREGGSACRFFNPIDQGCRVYDFRPLECRVLKCWDNTEIINVYDKQRLSRKDLLSGRKKLWEFVSVHQDVCDYLIISRAVKNRNMTSLGYLVRYDRSYRGLAVENGVLEAETLDFFLGLPLDVTLRRYGPPFNTLEF